MASQTPRRALPAPGGRSSQINTASNPNLSAARKASLNALTAYAGPNQAALNNTNAFSSAAKMIGGDGRELDLGDTVDVPGDMHGVVKFIGSVKGKKGTFAGVELSAEFASKGKNDGDVDGCVLPVAPHLRQSRHVGSCLDTDLCVQDTLLHNIEARGRYISSHPQGRQTIVPFPNRRHVSANSYYAFVCQLQSQR